MDLDALALRDASLPNLERLARSLGIAVDPRGSEDARRRRLVGDILRKLQADRVAEKKASD